MERLTINEIIAHCKRRVRREEALNDRDFFETELMGHYHMHEYWEHRQVAEYLEELKKYRKAEEQGLLLRLPCKVGDTVWVIDTDYEHIDSRKKKVYEAEWVRVNLVQNKAEGSFELHGEVAYQVYDYFYDDGRTMRQGMYVGQITTKIGERVFLTREEAESALAEKGGAE